MAPLLSSAVARPCFLLLLSSWLVAGGTALASASPAPTTQPRLHPQPAGQQQAPLFGSAQGSGRTTISHALFSELEELARLVDISYCVGATGGISSPFECAGRCGEFEGFELVTTWNTGILMSDSSGYMALSHAPFRKMIVVAFRGTYSIGNTVVDLSTVPQEYVPYPGGDGDDDQDTGEAGSQMKKREIDPGKTECTNCTVHAGFMRAWRETRPYVLPPLEELVKKYPDYRVTLVGHSLGGAIAALASLDLQARGWDPLVTTFGEPRIGNAGLVKYLDASFTIKGRNRLDSYRRVTHVNDPIPLLPLTEWGYRMHAGEIYISKPDLPPSVEDLWFCDGDEDMNCIAGAESLGKPDPEDLAPEPVIDGTDDDVLAFRHLRDGVIEAKGIFEVPARWRIWELFFAHRDYFWRIGLCVPGGDPKDWYRKYPHDEPDEL